MDKLSINALLSYVNPKRCIHISGIALAVLGLAGCSGVPVISNTDYEPGYTPSEWRGGPVVPVVVSGNPFAVPSAELDQAVISDMSGSGFPDFTPANGAPSPYRVVMAFSQPGYADYTDLCALPRQPQSATDAPSGSRTQLTAVLCSGGKPLTYAAGSIGTTGGVHGADFQWGISQFTLALFPDNIMDRR